MVIGLGLMGGGEAARTEARVPTPRTWQEIEAARELEQQRGNNAAFASVPDMRRIKAGAGTDDADPLKSAVTEPAPVGTNSDAANSGQASADHTATSQDGTGAGAANSAGKGGDHAKTNPLAGGAGHPDSGGKTHVGGGGATAATGNDGSVTGGNTIGTGNLQARRPAPVWRAEGWPADQAAAREAIRNGVVPDARRDLVREYFERE